MPIEFHCEHCQHEIRAPDQAGGKKGRCPNCQGVVYIPAGAADSGEIPLAPIDDAAERRAAAELAEARRIERQLLRERATPDERGRRQAPGGGASPAPLRGEPRELITRYVTAMAESRIEEADRCAAALAADRARSLAALDAVSVDPTSLALPSLPGPLLTGFLKQLRARL